MSTDTHPDPKALTEELSRAAGWPFAAPQGALTGAAAELCRLVAENEALKAAIVELDAAEFAYAKFTRDEGMEKHRQNRERRIAAWQAARKLVGIDT